MTPEEAASARRRVLEGLARAGIVVTAAEAAAMEITDVGLGDFERIGMGVVVYVNTARVCAKELVLLPRQTFPEHRHPPVAGEPGKEETFRCRWGVCYLYVPGEPTPNPAAVPPPGRERTFTVWHEVTLRPGDQYTLLPDTPHWFQAGDEGAVVSEFSTRSRDESDVFTDPAVRRVASAG
jgi:D-lyxose ketol-isomerase